MRFSMLSLLLLMACGSKVPDGYYDMCETDMDCRNDFQCLEGHTSTYAGEFWCTLPCDDVTDCPAIVDEDGADLTRCDVGVCGFILTR